MIQKIVVHPGGAHKDDFLACALLLAKYPVKIERREPCEADLADPKICVVDVGGEWNEELMNFDHHQFPRDSEPLCALSLVLKHLDLYEEALKFCDWLEVTEWIDTRGIVETSKWLGLDRKTVSKLNSPVDVTILRRFAIKTEHSVGQPIWEVMKMIGEDLCEYISGMKRRLAYVSEHVQILDMSFGKKILFMPRSEPLAEDASSGMGRYVEEAGLKEEVVGMIYPDRRGEGYGISRYNDDKRLEFTKIEAEDDIHFAHTKGFIAKTSTTELPRLLELVEQSWVG